MPFGTSLDHAGLLCMCASSKVSSMQADAGAETSNPLNALADEVAATLAAMANPNPVPVLCTVPPGEKSVSDLVEIVRLSPAAQPQNLGKMRVLRLVATRCDGQTILCSPAGPKVRALLETLDRVNCAPGCRRVEQSAKGMRLAAISAGARPPEADRLTSVILPCDTVPAGACRLGRAIAIAVTTRALPFRQGGRSRSCECCNGGPFRSELHREGRNGLSV